MDSKVFRKDYSKNLTYKKWYTHTIGVNFSKVKKSRYSACKSFMNI